MDRCARFLNLHSDEQLLGALSAEQSKTERRDAALFALEFALAELWRSWGITPDAVLGAGVGEYAAAAIAGVLSCEDALALLVRRARLLQLAVHDGELNRMLDEFERAAKAVKFELPAVPFVSGIRGKLLAEGEIPGAEYWRLHVLQDVRLEEGIETLSALGTTHFLEVGPPGQFSEIASVFAIPQRRPPFFRRWKAIAAAGKPCSPAWPRCTFAARVSIGMPSINLTSP